MSTSFSIIHFYIYQTKLLLYKEVNSLFFIHKYNINSDIIIL